MVQYYLSREQYNDNNVVNTLESVFNTYLDAIKERNKILEYATGFGFTLEKDEEEPSAYWVNSYTGEAIEHIRIKAVTTLYV